MKRSTLWSQAVVLITLVPTALARGETPVRAQRREYGMTPHEHYDKVLHEVYWDITIIGIVFAAIAVYFLIAYRRRAPGEAGRLPKLSPQAAIGWLIIPTFLFMADDFYLFAKGWELHNQYREVPKDAYEVKVTGQIWSWTYTYPNGTEAYNELRVPEGRAVLLRMTSRDVIHSHYMPHFRVTEDLMPGRVTYQWFMPDKVGEYVVTCREYCGTGHSGMYGKVIVMPRNEFETWLASVAPTKPVARDAVSDKTAEASAADAAHI